MKRMQMKSSRLWIGILSVALALLLAFSGFLLYRGNCWQKQILELEATLDAVRAEGVLRQEELDLLNEIFSDESKASTEYQNRLLEQIDALKNDAAEKDAAIRNLRELLTNYEVYTSGNLPVSSKALSDLWTHLLPENRPLRTVTEETLDEKTGEVIATEEKTVPANVSFYYLDLTTGHTLSYNADSVMYVASVAKVAFVYAVFQQVVEFEDWKMHYDAEGNSLYDENGNPLFQGPHPNLNPDGTIRYDEGEEIYDLNRVWTFHKETMTEDGSGYIKDMEDGVQFTYLELIEYILRYSDNVAFSQIRNLFGYVGYYQVAQSLGVKGYANGFMRMSAAECGKFMKAIYAFTEENAKYGTKMKEAMIRSNYPMIIPHGVSPTPTAHKYGWDVNAYCDVAIVYNEYPYVLVVLSDMDSGESEEILYLREIVRSVHSIHKSLHSIK